MPDQPSLGEQNEIQETRHPNVGPFQSEAEADPIPAKFRLLCVSAAVMPVR